MRQIIESPSPNHNERPAGKAIDILLIHYTGMRDGDAALQRLRDPAAKVSSHYLIEEDGRIHRLVDESRRAWHAGVGYWAGERDINAASIGIELVNPGHDNGYRPFPQPQMAALIELGRAIIARHPIPAARVLGHSDIAPTRKIDPGLRFPWKTLADAGIGLWPRAAAPIEGDVQVALRRVGYTADLPLQEIVATFQRRYRPAKTDGIADPETRALIAGLLDRIGQRA